jgi:hypothetical protein
MLLPLRFEWPLPRLAQHYIVSSSSSTPECGGSTTLSIKIYVQNDAASCALVNQKAQRCNQVEARSRLALKKHYCALLTTLCGLLLPACNNCQSSGSPG